MPGDFRCLRCEHPCAYFTTPSAHGAAGALGTRHSPRPPFTEGRKFPAKSRAHGVAGRESMFAIAREGAALSTVIVRLDRTIQFSRDVSDGIDEPRRTGYPASAVYDGGTSEALLAVIARSEATKQSIFRTRGAMDCFAGAR